MNLTRARRVSSLDCLIRLASPCLVTWLVARGPETSHKKLTGIDHINHSSSSASSSGSCSSSTTPSRSKLPIARSESKTSSCTFNSPVTSLRTLSRCSKLEFGAHWVRFSFAALSRTARLLRLVTRKVRLLTLAQRTGFWWSVNVLIYTLLGIAFGYRIADLATHNDERALQFRILSFRALLSALNLRTRRFLESPFFLREL